MRLRRPFFLRPSYLHRPQIVALRCSHCVHFRENPLGELGKEVPSTGGQTAVRRVFESRCPFEGLVGIVGQAVSHEAQGNLGIPRQPRRLVSEALLSRLSLRGSGFAKGAFFFTRLSEITGEATKMSQPRVATWCRFLPLNWRFQHFCPG